MSLVHEVSNSFDLVRIKLYIWPSPWLAIPYEKYSLVLLATACLISGIYILVSQTIANCFLLLKNGANLEAMAKVCIYYNSLFLINFPKKIESKISIKSDWKYNKLITYFSYGIALLQHFFVFAIVPVYIWIQEIE